MLVHRTKKLPFRSTNVGSDISYFHKQTKKTLIRQLLQQLPDLGLLCLQRRQKASLWGKGLNDVSISFQKSKNRHEEQDELNDIQIRLPTLNRSSRSSLNAVDNSNSKSNNTLTVTQATLSLPSPSSTPDTESAKTQSTSGSAVSPILPTQAPTHNPNVVRISTL